MAPWDEDLEALKESLPHNDMGTEGRVEGVSATECSREAATVNDEGQVVVYIDGGCCEPAHKSIRRAGYGI